MRDYLIRRVALLVPTFFLATVLVFSLLRFTPGSAIDVMLQETGTAYLDNSRTVEVLKHEFGLDKPVHIQYWEFITGIFSGNLGNSFWLNHGERTAVRDIIGNALPVTMKLAVLGACASVTVGITLGVISAIKQDTWIDYVLRSLSIAMLSMPGFWLATLVVIFPAIWWGILPPVFFTPWSESPIDNLKIFIAPVILLGVQSSAGQMRMTRSMMLEVLRQDYIRTAWAKGLNQRAVIIRHALKNALIPVVTIAGLQMTFLLGGTVILESIFGLPGMGRELITAIRLRDYPTVQGINVFFISVVICMNLLVDLSYGYLDPRIRFK